MNSINRLEENWTPQWDLGLQDEFGFLVEEKAEEPALALPSDRPSGWAMATREAMERHPRGTRRLACGASSVGDLIAFFESLGEVKEER